MVAESPGAVLRVPTSADMASTQLSSFGRGHDITCPFFSSLYFLGHLHQVKQYVITDAQRHFPVMLLKNSSKNIWSKIIITC